MTTIFQKLSFFTFSGVILPLSITTPAAAAIFNISGSYGDAECFIGPAGFPGLENIENIPCPSGGGRFSQDFELDYSPQIGVEYITAINGFNFGAFGETFEKTEDRVTVSFRINVNRSGNYFTASFEPPSPDTPAQIVGDFIDGSFTISLNTSATYNVTTFNVESATITRISPPVSVPEPSAIAGLTVLGLVWLVPKNIGRLF